MFLYANNAVAQLRTSLTTGATSLQVEIGSGALFPSPSGSDVFALTIEDRRTRVLEIVYVTARAGDTMTIVRAREGTTAKAFAAGAEVSCRITSAMLADLRNQQMAAPDTIMANLTPAIAVPVGQSPANIMSRFSVFSEGGKGLVPAPGAGALRMLASDGSWVPATDFVGPPGPAPELGVGNVVHSPYTSPLQVQLRPVAGGYLMDMNIPRGQPGVAPTMVGGTATSVAHGQPPAVNVVQISPTSFRVDLSVPDGAQGIAGPMPTLQVGTVTTGDAGSDANISFSFDGVDTYTADFLIPRGYDGPPPDISTGAVTTLPPSSPATVSITNLGEGHYSINFGIPQGYTGSVGPAPILQTGTITTLPPNTPADVQIVPVAAGTYKMDMQLPQGPAGAGTGDMLAANNLSELTDPAAARDHLGLGSAALSPSTAFAPSSHVGAGGAAHAAVTTTVAGFMSAADKVRLNGMADGATANATDAQLRDRATHTGVQAIATITGLQTALNAKVSGPGAATDTNVAVFDGVTGGLVKDGGYSISSMLSRANHTGTQAISTIAGLQGQLDAKASGDTLAAHIGAGGAAHAAVTTTVAGFMSAADKVRLNGMADGATANATDAQLRDRATHTGVQAIATITGLQTALDGKVAGPATAVTDELMAFNGTTGKLAKSAGYTAAALLSRANHTGAQAIATVTGLQAALDDRPTGAAVSAEVAAKAVRYDALQSLTEASKGIARANAGAGVLSGYRNKIINGDFTIWQRGSTQTTAGYGSVDRFNCSFEGGSQSVSQVSFTLGQTDVPGNPIRFLRNTIVGGSAASNYHVVAQAIENARILSGKKVTVTFYAKANATKSISVELSQNFGSGGSTQVDGIGVKKFSIGTTWTKCQTVVDVPSIAGKILGSTADYTSVNIWLSNGSTWNGSTNSLGVQSGTFDIAHLSLVEGDATAEDDPFEQRHYQQELALCQRYYELLTSIAASGYTTLTPTSYSCRVAFAVQKRIIPTMTVLSWDDTGNVNNQRFGYFSERSATFFITATATGQGWMFGVRAIADAEL